MSWCSPTWRSLSAKLQAKAGSGEEDTVEERKFWWFVDALVRRKMWVPLCVLCRDSHAGVFLLAAWVQAAGQTSPSFCLQHRIHLLGPSVAAVCLPCSPPRVLFALLVKILLKQAESAVLVSDYLPFSICSNVLTSCVYV